MRTLALRAGKFALASLLPAGLLLVLRWLAAADLFGQDFWRGWLFAFAVLLVAVAAAPPPTEMAQLRLPRRTLFLWGAFLLIGLAYWLGENTWLAWLSLAIFYAALLGLAASLGDGRTRAARLFYQAGFALAGGALPVLVAEIESHFSDEEFFTAVAVLEWLAVWLALRAAFGWLRKNISSPAKNTRSLAVSRCGLTGFLLALATLFGGITVRAYQHSFFSAEAPAFPGVSAASPFLCENLPAASQTYIGEQTFARLLARLAANPRLEAPDYGMLALGSGDPAWAQQFRQSLLAEAESGKFTQPAGSVKYDQYRAALRAYYYPKVAQTFPDLFSPTETETIQEWFAAINRRAFHVEAVDWMYALAFGDWPQGPYENQENGAGLLALLETNGLADPGLSARNQAYLAENRRGWLQAFRVTDDAAVYQPEWIENAWFQAAYSGETNFANLQRSFEWLKLLAAPDGSPLGYNHLTASALADSAYWGAALTGDAVLLWLAGRALDYLEAHDQPLSAQPGAETALPGEGRSPQSGSCLLYGNSGLPTQNGPLAPDKIVLRGGWEADDLYLLLNLRFSGWHRYKASNAIVSLYQAGPLLVEQSSGPTPAWLPEGRSLFRDKRIPRENLNGLLVSQRGLGAVLYALSGHGSPWAQDPPYYAEVARFEPGEAFDLSVTRLADWHGWQHERAIYFYASGVVAIFDRAAGPRGQAAALTWHLAGENLIPGERILLREEGAGQSAAEVLFLPITATPLEFQSEAPVGGQQVLRAEVHAREGGEIQTVTLFLLKDWSGARATLEAGRLQIDNGMAQLEIDLEEAFDGN